MKRILAAAISAVMVLSMSACTNKDDSSEEGCIYGKITSIEGNDVTLSLVELSDKKSSDSDSSSRSSDSTDSGKSERSGRPQKGEMPEGFDPENMPEGFDPEQFGGRSNRSDDTDSAENLDSADSSESSRKRPSGELPEGVDPENLPEGFDKSNMPEGFDPENLPEGFDKDNMPGSFKKSGDNDKSKSDDNGGYTLTGEEKELRIPVGVTVTTSSGVKTSFDSLSEGDIIKVKIEEDSDGNETVTEVSVVGQ